MVTLAGRLVTVLKDRLCLADASGTVWIERAPAPAAESHRPPPGPQVAAPAAFDRAPGPTLCDPDLLWPSLVPGDVVQAAVETGKASWRLVRLGLLAKALRETSWAADPSSPETAPGGGASVATLRRRASVVAAIRRFFDDAGFLEVETPILARYPGLEPHIDPFESRYRPVPSSRGEPVFLLTSPEYAMKRLVAAGIEKVYQLSRVFRNGELGPFHNPEFTLLEWYRAFASYLDIQQDVESLVRFVSNSLGRPGAIQWQGHTVDLSPPWSRRTVRAAVLETTGIDLAETRRADVLTRSCRAIGVDVPPDSSWDDAFFRLLADRVEPRLGFDRPLFLVDYPVRLAALAKVRDDPVPVAERFELYIAGVEVANAYTELNDPVAQRARFEEEREVRRTIGAPVFESDPDYLETLEAGLPPCGGIALGVDRLVMLLLDLPDVRRAMAFPFCDGAPEEAAGESR